MLLSKATYKWGQQKQSIVLKLLKIDKKLKAKSIITTYTHFKNKELNKNDKCIQQI